MARSTRYGILLAGLLLACGGGSSVVGKWESNFGGVVKMELKADGTAVFTTMGIDTEGTWESKGKNQILVKSSRGQDMTLTLNDKGELEDNMLGVFTRAK